MSLTSGISNILGIGATVPDLNNTSALNGKIYDPSTESGVYSVKILIGSTPVIARLPESFQFGVKSEWDNAVSMSESTPYKVANFAGNELLGVHFKSQKMTAQVWSGNSPVEFTLPLQFKAIRSSVNEVLNPIRNLMKASLPSLNGNFLSPPGPHVLTNEAKAAGFKPSPGTPITLMLGKFLHFTNLIITQVDSDIKSIMSIDNGPMSADVTVSFRSLYSFTTSDIDQFFLIK